MDDPLRSLPPPRRRDPARGLLWAHRYAESISAYRARLTADPNDMAAADGLAAGLQADGQYAEAIPLLKRVDEYMRQQRETPGHPGRAADLSCLHWCLNDRVEAIRLMRGLVAGILDRSIGYADTAGGVEQGNLLYYMGVTVGEAEVAAFALSYLEKLSRKPRIASWPGPVAQYLLGQMDTAALLVKACGHANVREASRAVAAQDKLLFRRQLCVALFHAGTRARAAGAEGECLKWMRACVALENPLIESEWYLARHEVFLADSQG